MIRIRKAVGADAERIAEIYVETWRTTYAGTLPDRVLIGMSTERQATSWARAIQHSSEIVMVAEDEDSGVVALASGGVNRMSRSRFEGEVYTLYVQPDYQDQGIGRRLLGRMFRELAGRGLNSAVIWVLAPNPSRFFYEAMGGLRVGDRDEKLWGTTLKELAYGWTDLTAALRAGRPAVE